MKNVQKDIFLLLLDRFLSAFFSFVLEKGKNPENSACFLGVKIFRNVQNFRKTGIYEYDI